MAQDASPIVIDISANTEKVTKAIAKMQKLQSNSYSSMTKTVEQAYKKQDGELQGFMKRAIAGYGKFPKQMKMLKRHQEEYSQALKGSKTALKTQTKGLEKQIKTVRDLEAGLKDLGETATDAQRKELAGAKEVLAVRQKNVKALEAQKKAAEEGRKSIIAKREELADNIKPDSKAFRQAASEAGDLLTEPLKALFSKDLPGAIKSFSKLAAAGGGIKKGDLRGVSGALSKHGSGLMSKGTKKGGTEKRKGIGRKRNKRR